MSYKGNFYVVRRHNMGTQFKYDFRTAPLNPQLTSTWYNELVFLWRGSTRIQKCIFYCCQTNDNRQHDKKAMSHERKGHVSRKTRLFLRHLVSPPNEVDTPHYYGSGLVFEVSTHKLYFTKTFDSFRSRIPFAHSTNTFLNITKSFQQRPMTNQTKSVTPVLWRDRMPGGTSRFTITAVMSDPTFAMAHHVQLKLGNFVWHQLCLERAQQNRNVRPLQQKDCDADS